MKRFRRFRAYVSANQTSGKILRGARLQDSTGTVFTCVTGLSGKISPALAEIKAVVAASVFIHKSHSIMQYVCCLPGPSLGTRRGGTPSVIENVRRNDAWGLWGF